MFSQSASLQRWPRKGEIFKDYSDVCVCHCKLIKKRSRLPLDCIYFYLYSIILALLENITIERLPGFWQSENTWHALNLLWTSHPHRIAFTIEERIVFWTTDNICRWVGQALGEMGPQQVTNQVILDNLTSLVYLYKVLNSGLIRPPIRVLFKSNMFIWSEAIPFCNNLINSVYQSIE